MGWNIAAPAILEYTLQAPTPVDPHNLTIYPPTFLCLPRHHCRTFPSHRITHKHRLSKIFTRPYNRVPDSLLPRINHSNIITRISPTLDLRQGLATRHLNEVHDVFSLYYFSPASADGSLHTIILYLRCPTCHGLACGQPFPRLQHPTFWDSLSSASVFYFFS